MDPQFDTADRNVCAKYNLYIPVTVMGSASSAQNVKDATFRRNDVTLSSLKPGDLVKFHRYGYYHWAVYIGNSQIVHISEATSNESQGTKNLLLSSLDLSKVNIRVDSFWDVAGSDKASKANDRDEDWRPLASEDVVKRALSFVGLGNINYNVFSCNCEHFAKWCRYDRFHSDQVHRLKIYKPKVLLQTVTAATDKMKAHLSKALDHRENKRIKPRSNSIEENTVL